MRTIDHARTAIRRRCRSGQVPTVASLALSVVGLAGCPDRTLSGVTVVAGAIETKDIAANPRRDVDILFLVDNSGSMSEEQASLEANFHRFIDVLQSLDGGLPNIHIGVTTSDLGTSTADGGDSGNKLGCNGKGMNGALVPLAAGGPRFIEDVDDGAGGRRRNYTGALTDVFAQIANVGTMGCGIEQHLEAVKRALEPTNALNAGFLRDDAYLAVIVIGDEDDCSLQHVGLFDGGNTPTLGTEINFRCTEEGVACDQPATDFLSATGPRKSCHPRANSPHLEDTKVIADFLKGLKADPLDVIVAGIVGDPTPFGITKDGTSSTVLDHSCKYTGATGDQFAFPAVRTADFLTQFPQRNTHTSICGADLSSALTEIGLLLKKVLADPCFEVPLADMDPTAPGPQYDCAVTEVRHRANHPDEELDVLPACTGHAPPCWEIIDDAAHCSYTHTDPHLALHIDRGGQTVGDDIHIKASCVTTDGTGGPLM